LLPVLQQIWANAWELGVSSARHTTGYQGQPSQQAYQQMLNRYASQWIAQIIGTILKGISAILLAGGAGIGAAIIALLSSATSAAMVVQTEITRAMAAGAAEVYQLAGVPMVEWVTDPDPPEPCPLCLGNEADGPHFLGQPFSSGAIQPPQHPRCRCALLPVMEGQ
jgi:hypothetical protein